MVFVGWAEDGTRAGVAPEGVLYTADAPDGDCTERGNVDGQPEALTVHSADAYYAATGGLLATSVATSPFALAAGRRPQAAGRRVSHPQVYDLQVRTRRR